MNGNPLHFARVDFRNDDRVFGIKTEDRFSHIYIIGKTGTGKSTLLETMALQDLERGNGFALIDPHGDLVARVAARIPASHQDKVIYLNATDEAMARSPATAGVLSASARSLRRRRRHEHQFQRTPYALHGPHCRNSRLPV
jgi:ATPase subunit of ABC transporter with duplicated ATPase domains